MACTAGAPTRTTKDLLVRAQACLGRHVVTGLLGCSIATEKFLSRQRWPILCHDRDFNVTTSWVARAFCVETQFWRRDKGATSWDGLVSRHDP